jgi:iron complex transport system substrate-binding protein
MKNKIFTLVEIAIVLCSLFLVATLPAAAITNYESGITNYEEAASEDDYVLGVYGNANEDDTIDMRDLTYVKLIFFGKKPETELADAKYDGKINPLDFIQIKLIIVGKEKEITIVDSADRIVTVSMPVERIVAFANYNCEVLRSLNAKDKIVGIDEFTKYMGTFFPKISELPSVGTIENLDIEAILSLEPDIVLTFGTYKTPYIEEKLEGTGIEVVSFYFYDPKFLTEEITKLGYMIDRRDEAEEFIGFYEGVIDSIKSTTEGIPWDEKPKVYYECFWKDYMTGNKHATDHWLIETAGGINIAADVAENSMYIGYPTVDPEWIIEQNPDIIIKRSSSPPYGSTGYEFDDDSGARVLREKIMNRPGFGTIDAVKEGKVYIEDTSLCGFIAVAYRAKVFHPDLFEELDPQAIHQRYLSEFQKLDYDLDEHGVLWYPPLKA